MTFGPRPSAWCKSAGRLLFDVPAPLEALERVTAAAFGQRRKMLRQSLKALGVPPADLIAAVGVAETARAEELDVEAFCALARAYAEAGG
jgi:16S rRNA (adenine1518-N6/adenine1519-N6)-dimethyltransferase